MKNLLFSNVSNLKLFVYKGPWGIRMFAMVKLSSSSRLDLRFISAENCQFYLGDLMFKNIYYD